MTDYIIKRGDIFLVDLGNNKGSEQSGYRPVMCLQNNIGNMYAPTIIVAPITSRGKKMMPTHVEIPTELGVEKNSIVLLEQLRTIDKNRIQKGSYVGRISGKKMLEIDRAMEISLGLWDRNTAAVKDQVEEVRFWERMLNMFKYDHRSNKKQLEEAEVKYNYELLKLENICRLNRVHMNDYYVINTTNKNINVGYNGDKVVISM